MKKFNFLLFVSIGLLSILSFIKGLSLLDPDFGWHLRVGQLVLSSGFLYVDPFSYSMPSFSYIDHEWLSNVLMFLINQKFGIIGLALASTLLFALTLFLSVPQNLYKNYSLPALILAGSVMLSFSGIRPQLETWVLYALLLQIILNDYLWSRFKYFIPFIFVFWVNLHGGFAFGIEILMLLFIVKSLQRKKVAMKELIVLIASFLATGINPYGFRIWNEILMTIFDSSLRFKIGEWTPSVFYLDIGLCVIYAFIFFYIIFYRKKLEMFELLLGLLLLIMAFSSQRHVPFLAIYFVFISSKIFYYIGSQISENKYSKERFKKISGVLLIIFLLIVALELFMSLSKNITINNYPVKAVNFLKTQNLEGNLFSTYNFGGYLIWKLPQKKVFIDGRMPSWKRAGNFPGESNNAFEDYSKMLSDDKFFMAQLTKYDIHYVLFPKTSKQNKSDLMKMIINIEKKLTGVSYDNHILSTDLTKFDFEKIYDDGINVVYKK